MPRKQKLDSIKAENKMTIFELRIQDYQKNPGAQGSAVVLLFPYHGGYALRLNFVGYTAMDCHLVSSRTTSSFQWAGYNPERGESSVQGGSRTPFLKA